MFYITFLEGSSEMLEMKNDVNKLAKKFDLLSERLHQGLHGCVMFFLHLKELV
jgi:hypothetical protein